jgi:hypothetical protein
LKAPPPAAEAAREHWCRLSPRINRSTLRVSK